MKRSPSELGDRWVGEPDHPRPRPRGKDVIAAIAVFVVLPGIAALVMVGAYLATVAR